MKVYASIILLFCLTSNVKAQEQSKYRIISSNFGSSGSSQTIISENKVYKISQSIGQASVIGTHKSNNGYVLRQGYQQPLDNLSRAQNIDFSLNASVYPNPFSHQITIKFQSIIKDDIATLLVDVTGKVIFSKIFSASQTLNLQITNIQKGTYFLKVVTDNKQFNTKLIKI